MFVLLIDDDRAVRTLVRKVLSSRGFEVAEFEKGVEALEFFKVHRQDVDLVIVDKVMPDLSGIELLQKMSELKPHLRALISSGLPEESADLSGIPDTTRVGYLAKPYSVVTLVETVTAFAAS